MDWFFLDNHASVDLASALSSELASFVGTCECVLQVKSSLCWLAGGGIVMKLKLGHEIHC